MRPVWMICALITLSVIALQYRPALDSPSSDDSTFTSSVKQLKRKSFQHARPQETSSDVAGSFRSLSQRVINRVKSVVLFIGHSHSGHSIVGSILDSHPHIVVSHELDVFSYMDAYPEWSKSEIFNAFWNSSVSASNLGLRTDSKEAYKKGYSLVIHDLYQGAFESYIDVIGDKKGGKMTQMLIADPEHWKELYDRLQSIAGLPVKIFHVIRNPFDNIATTVIFTGKRSIKSSENFTELKQGDYVYPLYTKFIDGRTRAYFNFYQAIEDAKTRFDLDVIEVHGKDLITNPKDTINKMCDFLQVNCDDHFISVCSDKVFPKESKTRYHLQWQSNQIKNVQSNIERFSNLHRYIEFDS